MNLRSILTAAALCMPSSTVFTEYSNASTHIETLTVTITDEVERIRADAGSILAGKTITLTVTDDGEFLNM